MTISTRVLDFGLDVLRSEATAIVLCQLEPIDYSLASLGGVNCIGYRLFGAGSTFGAPGPADPNGRKVTSTAITDGTIMTSGSVQFWAAIDTDHGRLLGYAPLVNGGPENAGNRFSLSAVSVRIPASQ